MLLFLDGVEGVVEFTNLVMNQGVIREAVLGEPGAVQPIAVKAPFEKAALDDADEDGGCENDRVERNFLLGSSCRNRQLGVYGARRSRRGRDGATAAQPPLQ